MLIQSTVSLHVLACVCLPTLEFSPKHPETNSKAVTITRHVCAEMSMNLPRFAQFMVHHIAKLHGNLCLKCTKIRGLSLKFVVSSRSPDVSCLSQPKKKRTPAVSPSSSLGQRRRFHCATMSYAFGISYGDT